MNKEQLAKLKTAYVNQKKDWLGNTNVRVGSDGINYLGSKSKAAGEKAKANWMPCTLEELVEQKAMIAQLRSPEAGVAFYNSQYRAAQEVAAALKAKRVYYMRTDVKKCVASMRFATLEKLAAKWEQSREGYVAAMDALKRTAFHVENGDTHGFHRSMPLTTMFQEMLLTEIDQFFKAEYPSMTYVRYVDDLLIFDSGPFDWKLVHQRLATFVHDDLQLSLHPIGSEKTTYFMIEAAPPHNFVKLNWFDVSADKIIIRPKMISWLEGQITKIISATVKSNDLSLCVKDISVLLLGPVRLVNPKSFANAFIHSGNHAQAKTFDKKVRRMVYYHFSKRNADTIEAELKNLPSMRRLLP